METGSTSDRSISGQVRALLSQGRTAREVIAAGHKPGTVYKVQRQLRQEGRGTGVKTPGSSPGRRLTVEDLEPEVESHPEILKLRIELRQVQLRRQISEVTTPARLEHRMQDLEKRLDELTESVILILNDDL